MAIYARVAATLLAQCMEYRDQHVGLAALKAAVWEAAMAIVAVEDLSVRQFLQGAEGQLDIIEHTTEPTEVREATLQLVSEIEDRMGEYLRDTSRASDDSA